MKSYKIALPLMLALVLSAASYAADKADGKKGGTVGIVSEAPAGGDAKVVAVLKVKRPEEKSIDLMAEGEVATQLKDFAKKGARVKVMGEASADGKSMTVTKVEEAMKKKDK
jgi:hypothetical protein